MQLLLISDNNWHSRRIFSLLSQSCSCKILPLSLCLEIDAGDVAVEVHELLGDD